MFSRASRTQRASVSHFRPSLASRARHSSWAAMPSQQQHASFPTIDAAFVKQQLEKARKQYAIEQRQALADPSRRGVSDQSEWDLVTENGRSVFKRSTSN